MKTTRLLIPLLVFSAFFTGCVQQVPETPSNLVEYHNQQRTNPDAYPERTILLYNLQRVLDSDIETSDRVHSMELVTYLGGEDESVHAQLAEILAKPNTPPELNQAVLEFLLKKDYPHVAAYVVKALPQAKPGSEMRQAMLDWLAKHPRGDVLAEVVKLWAQEPSSTSPNEPRFRHLVERMSGRQWDQALIDGINTPIFFARGSALKVLTERIPVKILKARISKATPRTDAMKVLHAFIYRFDYIPVNGQQFATAASLSAKKWSVMDDAAKLSSKWQESYGYRFDIRDFHLLSELSRDPLRKMLRRTQIALELGQEFGARRHVKHIPSRLGAEDDYNDRFWPQVESLTMADLWNLYLLNEMLSSPRVQLALKVMGDLDRRDRRNAWGGLVSYENGKAEAKIYPSDQTNVQSSDTRYIISKQAAKEGRDSLCRFSAHFSQQANSQQAGPGIEELQDAKENNFYGLVLTSIGPDEFCAHYFNPDGTVVSMGTYPFGK